MSETVALDVLVEMGVLVISEPLPASAAAVGREYSLYEESPCWAYEIPRFATPYADKEKKLFEILSAKSSPQEVAQKAGVVVFLGAQDTSLLRYFLKQTGITVLIFEPDMERMEQFAAAVPAKELSAGGAFLFQGDLFALPLELPQLFPATLFENGFPVFYRLEGIEAGWPEYFHAVIELLEFLFYRYCIYPIVGQANDRGLPLRPMARALFFDQVVHSYENIASYVTQADIRPLRNLFAGKTAILVAAGQDVSNQLEFILHNQDRCVVIAVNNAVRALRNAGIEPHFVVINDSSLGTRPGFAGLAPFKKTALVGHCLAYLGEDLFPSRFLFGNHLPEIFGVRPMMRIYGSVITTAFALARHMGCTRCVLAGVQLCSTNPYSLNYAKGTIHEGKGSLRQELIHRYPQLYPVAGQDGQQLFTSLNFRDAALWLIEEIRHSDVDIINLARESIVYGPNIRFEACPELPEDPELAGLFRSALTAGTRTKKPVAEALEYIEREMETWSNTVGPIQELLAMRGKEFLHIGADVVAQLDRGNVSYLVQRFEDFDNARFHSGFWGAESSEEERDAALRYYLQYVMRMGQLFLDMLATQRQKVQALT